MIDTEREFEKVVATSPYLNKPRRTLEEARRQISHKRLKRWERASATFPTTRPVLWRGQDPNHSVDVS